MQAHWNFAFMIVIVIMSIAAETQNITGTALMESALILQRIAMTMTGAITAMARLKQEKTAHVECLAVMLYAISLLIQPSAHMAV